MLLVAAVPQDWLSLQLHTASEGLLLLVVDGREAGCGMDHRSVPQMNGIVHLVPITLPGVSCLPCSLPLSSTHPPDPAPMKL